MNDSIDLSALQFQLVSLFKELEDRLFREELSENDILSYEKMTSDLEYRINTRCKFDPIEEDK